MISAVLDVDPRSVLVAGTQVPPSHDYDAGLIHVMPIQWNPVLEPRMHIDILVSGLLTTRSGWAGEHGGVLEGLEDEAREAIDK